MISRRDFLKAAGIAVLSSQIPGFLLTSDAPPVDFAPLYGRVISGNANRQGLWVDDVIPILDTEARFYHTPYGKIPRHALQPLLAPPNYAPTVFAPPFMGEVTGASVALRHWCAGDAPAQPRKIGHGAVLAVVDLLEYDGIHWYGVQIAGDERVYWTPSAPISPVTFPAPVPRLTLHLDHAARHLTAFQAERPLFRVAFADKFPGPAGEYAINQHHLSIRQTEIDCASFVTSFGEGLHISGAYWHNRFGESWAFEGIEVPPYVAKWVYGATQGGARVMIA